LRYLSEALRIHYFPFDPFCFKNRDVSRLSLVERRTTMVPPLLNIEDEWIRISAYVEVSVAEVLRRFAKTDERGSLEKRKSYQQFDASC
jgi:hypothetical protein